MDPRKQFKPPFPLTNLNPFELHKHLINNYILVRKGATGLLTRDTSRDRRDIDVIRENHKFLWEPDETPGSWEERLAKKYYDKLFKEYCISDLSRYKENKIAMRWQTENELVTGKGQFVCGAKHCSAKEELRTWEVNFGYVEHGEKKNALVKLRLCPECSRKLNFRYKRKEVKCKRLNNQQKIRSSEPEPREDSTKEIDKNETGKVDESDRNEAQVWKQPVEDTEEMSRDEEFEEYLEQLLL